MSQRWFVRLVTDRTKMNHISVTDGIISESYMGLS